MFGEGRLNLKGDRTSLSVAFKVDQLDFSLPVKSFCCRLRLPVSVKSDATCASSLHVEPKPGGSKEKTCSLLKKQKRLSIAVCFSFKVKIQSTSDKNSRYCSIGANLFARLTVSSCIFFFFTAVFEAS